MRYYTIEDIGERFAAALRERSIPEIAGPNDVLVRVKSVSLNYKDLALGLGMLPFNTIGAEPVPGSDGAGEVVETGAGVEHFRTGDRVVASFFPDWLDGAPSLAKSNALGREYDGMLQEYVVLPADALVKIPPSLSYDDAAAFPCAGATAWHALMEKARIKKGDIVLTMGAGGVSLFALQIAGAAGATVISTTGRAERENLLTVLGADHVINYKTHPDWEQEVLRLTQGAGADVIVEVGGPATFQKSLAAAAFGGRISAVGVLSGLEGHFNPADIIFKSVSVNGIFVGSRAMLERALQFYHAHGLKPVTDPETFHFRDAASAYKKLRDQRHVGKIIIRVS